MTTGAERQRANADLVKHLEEVRDTHDKDSEAWKIADKRVEEQKSRGSLSVGATILSNLPPSVRDLSPKTNQKIQELDD